jgi:hypothetical protein
MKKYLLAIIIAALTPAPALAQYPPPISLKDKQISWVEHHPDGSVTFHFVDGDFFTVPPPLKQQPVEVPSSGDGGGGW